MMLSSFVKKLGNSTNVSVSKSSSVVNNCTSEIIFDLSGEEDEDEDADDGGESLQIYIWQEEVSIQSKIGKFLLVDEDDGESIEESIEDSVDFVEKNDVALMDYDLIDVAANYDWVDVNEIAVVLEMNAAV